MSRLSPVASLCGDLQTALEEMESLRELEDSETDPELKDYIRKEIDDFSVKVEKIKEEAARYVVPEEKNDDRNVILEIRAGAGGDDSAIFVGQLFEMYKCFSEEVQEWQFEQLEKVEADAVGYRKAIGAISGERAFETLKYETGLHRAITETNGRLQTSAATVAILPEPLSVEINLNPNDLRIDVFRASGAGGQHVNTTESAVRVTHLPTKISVSIQDERCQVTNKQRALKLLKAKLYELECAKAEGSQSEMRKEQVRSSE
jgi:peptide chain release factor 1